MKEQNIHKLIERFLDGETTLEEERKLYAFFQEENVPEELKQYQEMFRGYAAIAPKESKRVVMRSLWWRVVSVAACFMLVSLIGYTLYIYTTSQPQEKVLVKNVPPQMTGRPVEVMHSAAQPQEEVLAQTVVDKPVEVKKAIREVTKLQDEPKLMAEVKQKMQTEEAREEEYRVSPPLSEAGELIYASNEPKADTVYQDPSRMDDFIVKLAAYHRVKQGELKCSQPEESNVVSAVYVFPDKEEIDVFGRLLQAACWYKSETPGYLLNFSHQQFFFELKDMRKQLQYRWIAERVNGKILLYGTHAPLGTRESSACYQEYRDELMHIKSINYKTKKI